MRDRQNLNSSPYPINAPASQRRNTSAALVVQMLSSATKARPEQWLQLMDNNPLLSPASRLRTAAASAETPARRLYE